MGKPPKPLKKQDYQLQHYVAVDNSGQFPDDVSDQIDEIDRELEPVSDLKELFPYADRLGAAASSECEMYVYEITPISDEELLRDILADVPKKRLN